MLRTLLSIVMLALAASVAGAQDLRLFTLGSGDVSGGYYAAATAICDVVNRAERGRLRCSPDPTVGSIYNLNALRDRQIDFAIVQSDWHRQAYEGTGQYATAGPMANLRSVMGLYREILTIVVRPGAGITTTADLVGKRLDIGHPASGRRATVERVIAALGLKREDFSQIAELPTGNALDALCQGSIDATVLIIGHPNAAVGRAISKCGAILVPIIKDSQIEQALEDTLHLDRATIPGGSYPNLSKDVPSFALVATMVTRADTDDDIVKALVRSTLANLQLLGQNAPVLIHLDPVEMRTRGLAAPLHTGAQVAFDEVGPAR